MSDEFLKKVEGKSDGWKPVYLNLNKYIGNTQPVLVEFVFDTVSPYGFSVGWFIEDIKLIGEDITPPGTPTGLRAETVVSGIELNWNKVSDVDTNGYNIYRTTTAGEGYTEIGTTLNNLYTDNDVITDTTYFYKVTAKDFAGNESPKSEEVQHDYVEMEIIFATNFEDDNSHTIRDVLAHVGLSDVKAFGLEWKDCETIMEKPGFKLEVKAMAFG